jgi:hypothetical protein
MTLIAFSVSYTLSEYVSIVQEHAPTLLAKQRGSRAETANKPSLFTRGMISTVATISFFFKKRRMPVCDFVIDEQQIRRKTAAGELVVSWSDVVAVHRYSRGFLVEKPGGAMPLPYRCFSPEQSSAFVLLIERHQHGSQQRAT